MIKHLRLAVSGMHCGGCAQRATAAARRVDGVTRASADHAAAVVRVSYDPARTDTDAIAAQLARAGFPRAEAAQEAAEAGELR